MSNSEVNAETRLVIEAVLARRCKQEHEEDPWPNERTQQTLLALGQLIDLVGPEIPLVSRVLHRAKGLLAAQPLQQAVTDLIEAERKEDAMAEWPNEWTHDVDMQRGRVAAIESLVREIHNSLLAMECKHCVKCGLRLTAPILHDDEPELCEDCGD